MIYTASTGRHKNQHQKKKGPLTKMDSCTKDKQLGHIQAGQIDSFELQLQDYTGKLRQSAEKKGSLGRREVKSNHESDLNYNSSILQESKSSETGRSSSSNPEEEDDAASEENLETQRKLLPEIQSSSKQHSKPKSSSRSHRLEPPTSAELRKQAFLSNEQSRQRKNTMMLYKTIEKVQGKLKSKNEDLRAISETDAIEFHKNRSQHQQGNKRMTVLECQRFGIPSEYLNRVKQQASTRHLVDLGVKKKPKSKGILASLCCLDEEEDECEINHDLQAYKMSKQFGDLGITTEIKHFKRHNEKEQFLDQFVIPASNGFIIIWNSFVIILQVTSGLAYLYFASFRLGRGEEAKYQRQDALSYGFEFLFLVEMLLNFFKEFTPENTTKPVSDFSRICEHYLGGNFVFDLVTIIPLQEIKLHRKRERLFYLVKFVRLFRGLSHYSKQDIMNFVKQHQMASIQRMIENDPEKANNNLEDLTKNETILLISFLVKLLELITFIFSFSYFFTCLWVILCEFVEDFILDLEFENGLSDSDHYNTQHQEANFMLYFNLQHDQDDAVMLKVFYFAFTSLTTVGFGDYHPISTIERAFCGFMLFMGVLIFSYIMNEYNSLIDQYNASQQEYDEGDQLKLFFVVMKHFNENEGIDFTIQTKIEDYFIHRWRNYKNMAFQSREDKEMLEQLPMNIAQNIFMVFLYETFIITFNRAFSIKIPQTKYNKQQNSYFSWANPVYKDFMVDLMMQMEPRFEFKGAIVYSELEEVTEVVMFMNGKFDLGFEINEKKIYVLRYTNSSRKMKQSGAIIGDYGCSFNKSSRFIYKCASFCDGFYIRKKYWAQVMGNHTFVAKNLGLKIKANHQRQVNIINRVKKVEINKLKESAHIDQYKYVSLRDDKDRGDGLGDSQLARAVTQTAFGIVAAQPEELKDDDSEKEHFKTVSEEIEKSIKVEVNRLCESIIRKYENSIVKTESIQKQHRHIKNKFINQTLQLGTVKDKIEKMKESISELEKDV